MSNADFFKINLVLLCPFPIDLTQRHDTAFLPTIVTLKKIKLPIFPNLDAVETGGKC